MQKTFDAKIQQMQHGVFKIQRATTVEKMQDIELLVFHTKPYALFPEDIEPVDIINGWAKEGGSTFDKFDF